MSGEVSVGPVRDESSSDVHHLDESPEEATLTTLEVDALSNCLLAPEETVSLDAWEVADTAIKRLFPGELWGTFRRSSTFAAASLSNLFHQEMPRNFKSWLEANGIGEEGYASHIPTVQFNSVDIYLNHLFDTPYNRDTGWRIQLLGFPAVQITVIGLAHAPEGDQNQNRLGQVSALIREAALKILANNAELKPLLESYPSATRDHWDGSSLIPTSVRTIGGLNISAYDGNIRLNMIRNTSAKRQIATYFAITSLTRSDFEAQSNVQLKNFREIALRLGEVSDR